MVHRTSHKVCTRYPYTILLACSAVDSQPVFQRIPASYTNILRRLIKKVSATNGQQPIFCKRETLANESGCSLPTLYRALTRFEQEGWIERDWQACAGLRGSESHITFSESLCALLQLPVIRDEEEDLLEQEDAGNPVSDSIPDALLPLTSCTSTDNQGSALQLLSEVHSGASAEPVDKKQNSKSTPSSGFTKIGKFTIPSDLAWLVSDQGIKPSAVLMLMKAASQVKQRLSDISALSAQYLRKLSGQRLVAYLMTLIRSDRDWAWMANKKRGEEVVTAQKQAQREEGAALLQKAKAAVQGLWMRTKDGKQVVHVGGGGCVNGAAVYRLHGKSVIQTVMPTLTEDFLMAVEKGILLPCDPGTAPA